MGEDVGRMGEEGWGGRGRKDGEGWGRKDVGNLGLAHEEQPPGRPTGIFPSFQLLLQLLGVTGLTHTHLFPTLFEESFGVSRHCPMPS